VLRLSNRRCPRPRLLDRLGSTRSTIAGVGLALAGAALASPAAAAPFAGGLFDPQPAAPELRWTCEALGLDALAPAAADLPRQLSGELRVTPADEDRWVQLLALPKDLADLSELPLDQLGGLVLGTTRGTLRLDTREAGAARLLEGSDLVLQALTLDSRTGDLRRSERLHLTPVDAYVFDFQRHQGGWRAATLGAGAEGPQESPTRLALQPDGEGVLWREWRGLPPGAEVELQVSTRAALRPAGSARLSARLSTQRLQLIERNGIWELLAGEFPLEGEWRPLSVDESEPDRWRVELDGRTDASGRLWIALRAAAGELPFEANFERLTLLVRR
jgi:hypothetical protein